MKDTWVKRSKGFVEPFSMLKARQPVTGQGLQDNPKRARGPGRQFCESVTEIALKTPGRWRYWSHEACAKENNWLWVGPAQDRGVSQSTKLEGKNHQIWSLSCWFWSCFGPVFFHYGPFPAFWSSNVCSVPLYVGSTWSGFQFWFYSRLHLRDCQSLKKRLWTFKQGSDW